MSSDYREKLAARRAARAGRLHGSMSRVLWGLLLLAAIAAGLGLRYWRTLLEWQSNRPYAAVFKQTHALAAKALGGAKDQAALDAYAASLVKEGNLGRAVYLCDLYGAKCAALEPLREAVQKSRAAAAKQEVYDLKSDPVWSSTEGTPCHEVLRYLLAYRHALSGDWVSARNEFAAIDPPKLPAALRPYRQYFLARAYRLAGTEKEKAQVEKLLTDLIKQLSVTTYDTALLGKTHYALLSWELSDSDGKAAEADKQLKKLLELSKDYPSPAMNWSLQKAYGDYAAYYNSKQDYKNTLSAAAAALAVQPEDKAGEDAGRLLLEQLRDGLKGRADSGLGQADGVVWSWAAQGAPDLAHCAVAGKFGPDVAAAFREILKIKSPKAARAGLETGLAWIYRQTPDLPRFKALLAQANLEGIDDKSLAEIYFQYAQLIEEKEQWNEALSYYKSTAKLGGPRQSEALYHCYEILKEVQEPLNLTEALGYLQDIVAHHEGEEGYAKAVEELLPLWIYTGHKQEAAKLAAQQDPLPDYGSSEEAKRYRQLVEVAAFWQTYLNSSGHPQISETGTEYWNYYEMAAIDPARPSKKSDWTENFKSFGPQEYEYLAGLGLTDEAEEALPYTFDKGQFSPAPDLLWYLRLRQAADNADTATLQDLATAVLESGELQEQPVLDYVLSLAYPQPYADEVKQAASATGVDPALIYAVMKKESAFKQDNQSWVGAEGLMQLMPGTVRFLIDARGLPADYFARRTEPGVNIRLGAEYLKSLAQELGVSAGSDDGVRAILHSYNGGPANYQKWRKLYPGADPVLFTSLVPNEQNESYAMLVFKYYKIYKWLGKQ